MLAMTNVSTTIGPGRDQQRSRLLELPNELLLNIGRKLTANKHICQLSLVCLKLKHVAQEALMKETMLSPHSMPDLVRTLCDRPDLCEKINSVEIDEFVSAGWSCPGSRLEEWSHFDKCRRLVGNAYYDLVYNECTSSPKGIWSNELHFFLDVILKSCPNVREVALKLPGHAPNTLQAAWGQQDDTPIIPFQGMLRILLGEKLKTLRIHESESFGLFRTSAMMLSPFPRLVRLSVPANALRTMSQRVSSAHQALPPSLHHLDLKPCNHCIITWLPDLVTACTNGTLPNLNQINLHFPACLRDSLISIDQGRGFLKSLRDIVTILAKSRGISLRAYDRFEVYTGNLLEELDAWSLLSDAERWYPVYGDEEFSVLVARTEKGAVRRRTKEEIRAYVRRDEMACSDTAKRRKSFFKPALNLYGIKAPSFLTDTKDPLNVLKPSFTGNFACWSFHDRSDAAFVEVNP